MPTVRDGVVAGAIGDQLYVVGGGAGGSYYDVMEVYDPASNLWTTAPAMRSSGTSP